MVMVLMGLTKPWNFHPLFINLNKDKSAIIIKSGSPSRWQTHYADYGKHLCGLDDLEKSNERDIGG